MPWCSTRRFEFTGKRLISAAALLVFSVSWNNTAAGEHTAEDDQTESGETGFDWAQRNVSASLNNAAQWVDAFFDDERFVAEDATTKVRLRESAFFEHGDSVELKTKVSLSVDFPKTKQRLRLFIASEEDTDKTPDTLFNRVDTSEDSSAAGIQVFAERTRKRNLSLTAGIKLDSQEFFIGPRYRRTFKFDDFNLRFTQRVRWLSSKGWEATTRGDYERLLSKHWFFRHTIDGRWRDEDPGYRYEIRPTLVQQLASRQAIEYQWNNLFETDPNHSLESSTFLVRYRRNFLRNWLFYEINPQVAMRDEEDFDPKLGITFQIEVVFGGKEFLGARPKPAS